MADSPAAHLIAQEINHPEYATLLNDIRDFDWVIVNRLRKEDLVRIQFTGFQFKSKGTENQKMEFKSFLLDHPSCMASDFQMILNKLNIFSNILGKQTTQTYNVPRPTVRTPIVQETEDSEVEEVPRKKKTKKAQKRKRRVIVIEEEDEEEDSYDDDDVEYIPVPYKRPRKYR